MRRTWMLIAAVVISFAVARDARADEKGNFVFTLGVDTTSVETWTRTSNRLEVDQVGRAPRVLRRKSVYQYKGGGLEQFSMVVTPPGADAPTQVIEAKRDGDSVRVSTRTGNNPAVASAFFVPRDMLVALRTSPWAIFEAETRRLAKSKADTLGGRILYIGATTPDRWQLKKLGRDSVSLWVSTGDLFHIRVDKDGRLLGSRPLAGTFQVALTRPASLDVDAMAANYRAREQGGASLGMLSPRDTVRAVLPNGGTLLIDYGRPAKRGRVVFGGIVPYGEVWRTGANAATQLKVDKDLTIAGTVVPAGAYTLWTVPGAAGWKLVLNSETGQWGTAHKAERDVFTTDMNLSVLPQAAERFTISVEPTATGGLLHLDWDTTRASVGFEAKP